MMETIQEILNFSVGKLTVGNIISALVIFLVCHAVIKALMGPIERLLDKLNVDLTLRGFLRTVIRVVLNFVAVCIVAESIGIPIASLLAVLGMLGLAVSLSVQGALSNLSNGIMLLITKPFKAGDYIAAALVSKVQLKKFPCSAPKSSLSTTKIFSYRTVRSPAEKSLTFPRNRYAASIL